MDAPMHEKFIVGRRNMRKALKNLPFLAVTAEAGHWRPE